MNKDVNPSPPPPNPASFPLSTRSVSPSIWLTVSLCLSHPNPSRDSLSMPAVTTSGTPPGLSFLRMHTGRAQQRTIHKQGSCRSLFHLITSLAHERRQKMANCATGTPSTPPITTPPSPPAPPPHPPTPNNNNNNLS